MMRLTAKYAGTIHCYIKETICINETFNVRESIGNGSSGRRECLELISFLLCNLYTSHHG